MAEINFSSINGRVVTHVRGRVFRFEPRKNRQSLVSARPREKRRVCLLSAHDAANLEQWGINQPCFGRGCRHIHMTRDAISEMERAGVIRWVGAGKNVAAYADGKTWQPRMSAGMTVLQLVEA